MLSGAYNVEFIFFNLLFVSLPPIFSPLDSNPVTSAYIYTWHRTNKISHNLILCVVEAKNINLNNSQWGHWSFVFKVQPIQLISSLTASINALFFSSRILLYLYKFQVSQNFFQTFPLFSQMIITIFISYWLIPKSMSFIGLFLLSNFSLWFGWSFAFLMQNF